MSHPIGESDTTSTTLLRTRRLALRAWTGDDLPAYFDLYSRWEVMRWLGAHPRRPVADPAAARERLHRVLARHEAVTEPLGVWAIVPHETGIPVGTVLLLPLRDAGGPTGEVEVGWHLHPDHQGRGLATEAARALLGIAALPRVLALTDPDNERSQAVAGRLGLADEGLTDRWFGLTTRQFAG
jgi:RimJ/RimL family protein N-acetyltransferase